MIFVRKLLRLSLSFLPTNFVKSSNKMIDWGIVKESFLSMPIDKKRGHYKCGKNFKTISDIPDWRTYANTDEAKAKLVASPVVDKGTPKKSDSTEETKSEEVEATPDKSPPAGKDSPEKDDSTKKAKIEEVKSSPGASSVTGNDSPIDDRSGEETKTDEEKATLETREVFLKNDVLNEKISLFTGDITSLEIDAIVNAANDALMCGGGVDGAIHSAAGHVMLKAECWDLDGCDTGDAKITGGYMLPAKYVLHAVGPKGEDSDLLSSCYKKSMDLLMENGLETIAFPCISTGIYGYPNEKAASVAVETIRKWLDENEYSAKVKRVVFCLFLNVDIKIYHKLLPKYFPL